MKDQIEESNNITIPKTQYYELCKQSQMLGQIGVWVEDFCRAEESVLKGVLKVLSDYYAMKADQCYEQLTTLREEDEDIN